jgi:hypothetical protein
MQTGRCSTPNAVWTNQRMQVVALSLALFDTLVDLLSGGERKH